MATIKELFEFAIDAGIEEDPRGREEVERVLQEAKDEKGGLEEWEEKRFDDEKTWNPYSDSRIHYGAEKDVKTLLVGIDVEVQDLLLADRLRSDGHEIDAVVGHHPEGKALAYLYEVMDINIHTLHSAGVSIAQAEAVTYPRMEDIRRGVHAHNHPRSVETARLLDLPYFNLHAMADNHVHQFVKRYLEEENDPRTLKDILKLLLELPEYEWAAQYGMGPTIFIGKESNRVGDLAYDMTGGTELDKERLEKMAQSGIDTIVGMHMSKEQIEEAEEQNINVVIAGHMASDSLGLNILLDKMQKEFDITVKEFSGFTRVER